MRSVLNVKMMEIEIFCKTEGQSTKAKVVCYFLKRPMKRLIPAQGHNVKVIIYVGPEITERDTVK